MPPVSSIAPDAADQDVPAADATPPPVAAAPVASSPDQPGAAPVTRPSISLGDFLNTDVAKNLTPAQGFQVFKGLATSWQSYMDSLPSSNPQSRQKAQEQFSSQVSAMAADKFKMGMPQDATGRLQTIGQEAAQRGVAPESLYTNQFDNPNLPYTVPQGVSVHETANSLVGGLSTVLTVPLTPVSKIWDWATGSVHTALDQYLGNVAQLKRDTAAASPGGVEGALAYGIPEAAGNVAAMAAGGLALKGVLAGAGAAEEGASTLLSGQLRGMALFGGGDAAEDIYHNAINDGATQTQAIESAGVGFALNSAMMMALGGINASAVSKAMGENAEAFTKGLYKPTVGEMAKYITLDAAGLGASGGATQLAQNAFDRTSYDPDRPLMQGVAEAAGQQALFSLAHLPGLAKAFMGNSGPIREAAQVVADAKAKLADAQAKGDPAAIQTAQADHDAAQQALAGEVKTTGQGAETPTLGNIEDGRKLVTGETPQPDAGGLVDQIDKKKAELAAPAEGEGVEPPTTTEPPDETPKEPPPPASPIQSALDSMPGKEGTVEQKPAAEQGTPQQGEAAPAVAGEHEGAGAEPSVTAPADTPEQAAVRSRIDTALGKDAPKGVSIEFSDAHDNPGWADPSQPGKVFVNPDVLKGAVAHLDEGTGSTASGDKYIKGLLSQKAGEEVIHSAQHSLRGQVDHNAIYDEIGPAERQKTIAKYGSASGKGREQADMDSIDPSKATSPEDAAGRKIAFVEEHARQILQRKAIGETTEDAFNQGDKSNLVRYFQALYTRIKAHIAAFGDNPELARYLKNIEGIMDDAHDGGQNVPKTAVAHEGLAQQLAAEGHKPTMSAEEMKLQDEERQDALDERRGDQETLLEAVKHIGGLTTTDKELQGELNNIKEAGSKGDFLNRFRTKGKTLDHLQEALTERGFHFPTLTGMLEAIHNSIRSGKDVFPTDFEGSQVAFAAKPDTGTGDLFGGEKPAEEPKARALQVYNKLKAIRDGGKALTGDQSFQMEQAERKLGQEVMPGMEGRAIAEKEGLRQALTDRVDQSYQELKKEQGGLSAVSIGKLAERSGIKMSVLHQHLLDSASRGEADLHPTTIIRSELSPRDLEGSLDVPGRNEPAITTTIRRTARPTVNFGKPETGIKSDLTTQGDLLGEKKPGQQSLFAAKPDTSRMEDSKALGRSLWDRVTGLKKRDQLTADAVKFGGLKDEAIAEMQNFKRQTLRDVPLALHREAMPLNIEAGGDNAVLAQQEKTVRASAKTPEDIKLANQLEAAQHLPPKALDLIKYINEHKEIMRQLLIKWGVPVGYVDNYITHMWKLDSRGEPIRRGGASFSGKFQSAKKRTIPTFFDGWRTGLQPETMDIGNLYGNYMFKAQMAVTERKFVADMAQHNAADGNAMISPQQIGKWIDVTSPKGVARLILKPFSWGQYADYKPMPELQALQGWYAAGVIDGKSVMFKSDMFVHPEVHDKLSKIFGESEISKWYRKPTTNPFERTAQIVTKAVADDARKWVKGTMLSSFPPGFHFVQEATGAIGYGVNPLRFLNGTPVDTNHERFRYATQVGGAKVISDDADKENFMEGFRTSNSLFLKGLENIPGIKDIGGKQIAGWTQDSTDWLFKNYIPRLKLATFEAILARKMDTFKKELASGKTNRDELAYNAGREANVAYGHLNYMDMARSPTLQHLFNIFALAPDFWESRVRHALSATTGVAALGANKANRESARSFAILGGIMYVGARVLNQMIDGDPHMEPENAFRIVSGNRAYGVRQYISDYDEMLTNTRTYFEGRMNPVARFVDEAVTGKNYRGEDTKGFDVFRDLLADTVPIPLQSLTRGLSKTGINSTVSILEQSMGAMGVKVSRFAPAQQIYPLAKAWNEAQGKPVDTGTYPASQYTPLKYALEDGDFDHAAKLYAGLVAADKGNTGKASRGLITSINHPFTGSKADDMEFFKTLSDDNKKVYAAAVDRRHLLIQRMQQMLQQKQGS